MNTGAIATRYAKALLEFSTGNSDAEVLCGQSMSVLSAMDQVPPFKEAFMRNSGMSMQERLELLQTAAGGVPCRSMTRFVALLLKNSRMDLFDRILMSFLQQYRRANNIVTGTLVTAVRSEELVRKITGLIHSRTGADVRIDSVTDPNIIGGFVFDIEGRRLDASVRTQLERVRKSLVDNNKKLF